MLVLTRNAGDSLMIGDDIKITVLAIGPGNFVRIGVNAPKNVPVHREEVYQRIQREQVKQAKEIPIKEKRKTLSIFKRSN